MQVAITDLMTAHAREPTTAGSQVRVLRSLLGITQEQMAQELGVSFATVNRWETGRRVPSVSSQRRLDALAASAPVRTGARGDRNSQPGVLLVPPTSFIGRELELGELEGLLKVSRLVALVGPGGSGKTRLAMELVRRSTKSEEPVTVVALDVVTDPKLVATAICAALGLRDVAGVSPEVEIISHLAAGPRLLVLDNCEHVVEAVSSLVAAVLTAAPELRVLATSRTVLNVPGEQVWVIPPLELPGLGSAPADVDRCDAGRLFVSRAQSRRPGFVLDPDTATAVVSICRLLDGLPLALELAAAWSAVLSAPELARHLEESLSLLDVSASRLGRQRTLRATVEWSDALLDPCDRDLLGQLSVFAGRFTLADVEAIITGTDGREVVFGLRRLVDSSWVVAEQEDETSYGLLNTLRDYGRELMERGGHADSIRARHAEAFTALAEASEAGLAGSDQAGWRSRMERANGDVAAALEWALESGEIDLSLRLVASLWRWWYTTGRILEGRQWAAAALALRGPTSRFLRPRALYAAAMLASENGDYDTAIAHARSARREFEAVGDDGGAARASTVLGNVAKYRGDIAAARVHLTDAVASQRVLADDWATAVALQNLASLLIDQAELSIGRELMEESVALKRRAGDRRSLGYGLVNLSDLFVREHTPERASAVLAEAATIAAALTDDRLAAFVDHNFGDIAVVTGDQAQAVTHYRRALAGFRRVHDRRDVALALCSLGRALVGAGERFEGLSLLRESETLAAELGDELRLAEARAALAAVALPPAALSLPGGLTARQAEILTLVAGGLSNRDIAARLALSAGTVERHLANIYSKVGVANRVGATRYALTHGLGAAPVP
jgi:predicted ATPase/DNA-binding CsgD family transcriptional regulator/DNA-binding transcriptional regulator YiaG